MLQEVKMYTITYNAREIRPLTIYNVPAIPSDHHFHRFWAELLPVSFVISQNHLGCIALIGIGHDPVLRLGTVRTPTRYRHHCRRSRGLLLLLR